MAGPDHARRLALDEDAEGVAIPAEDGLDRGAPDGVVGNRARGGTGLG
jgi:hypothetical protein